MNIKSGSHLKGKVRAIIENIVTGEKKILNWRNNIIPDCGLAAIARGFGNNAAVEATGVTNEGRVTYGALGNGTTVPTSASTKLENEVIRKQIATSSIVDGTSILIEFFFETSEGNYSITNVGLFGENATITKDSGTLFEYAFFDTPFTKTTQEVVTIQCVINFSQG